MKLKNLYAMYDPGAAVFDGASEGWSSQVVKLHL